VCNQVVSVFRVFLVYFLWIDYDQVTVFSVCYVQSVCLVCLPVEYFPSGHTALFVLSSKSGHLDPAGHIVHAIDPARDHSPELHATGPVSIAGHPYNGYCVVLKFF